MRSYVWLLPARATATTDRESEGADLPTSKNSAYSGPRSTQPPKAIQKD